MKRPIIAFGIFIFALSTNAQDALFKHSIGIQANIFLNENLFTGNYIQPVYALRYGYNLNKNISLGPEISGTRTFYRSMNIRDAKHSTVTFGGFGRYTFLPDKRVSPFAELSLYYFRSHFIPSTDPVASSLIEKIENKFTGYIAPGISLKSKSKKVSFDLMFKYSPEFFINSKHFVISYRLNYYF